MFVREPARDWRTEARASRQAGGRKSAVRAGSRCDQISREKKYSGERTWLRKLSHGSERRNRRPVAVGDDVAPNTKAIDFKSSPGRSLWKGSGHEFDCLTLFFFWLSEVRMNCETSKLSHAPSHNQRQLADRSQRAGKYPRATWTLTLSASTWWRARMWKVIGWNLHLSATNQMSFCQFKQLEARNSWQIQFRAKQN